MNRLLDGSSTCPPVPKPPYWPKYDPNDPNEEPSKWSLTRLLYTIPIEKPKIPYAKLGQTPKEGQPDWRGVLKENIQEYPMPDTYTDRGQYLDKKYFFFDTPDYADPFKKLWWSTKFFFQSGTFYGFVHFGIIKPRPFSLSELFKMYRKLTLPWFFAGMAGSMTVITIANLRGKKDDQYNHFFGGLAAACILGRKNHLQLFRAMIVMPLLAITTKYCNEENIQMIPHYNNRSIESQISGYEGNHGFRSGDWRFGFRSHLGDPGRDVRKQYP